MSLLVKDLGKSIEIIETGDKEQMTTIRKDCNIDKYDTYCVIADNQNRLQLTYDQFTSPALEDNDALYQFLKDIVFDKFDDLKLVHVKNQILESEGDYISIIKKSKSLLKYGRNVAVGTTRSTIWFTGQDELNEVYVADNVNSIDTISSSNAGDTLDVTIEGHTMSGGNRTFVSQTATLNGQNKVTLDTPLNRVGRLVNNNGTDLKGDVFVYEDTTISSGKPTTTNKIHLTVNGLTGKNQSEKAATSLSSQDYWILTRFASGFLEKSSTNVADVALEIRNQGGVFRIIDRVTEATGESATKNFNPFEYVKPNSDVRLTAEASTINQEIQGDIEGYLAIVIGSKS